MTHGGGRGDAKPTATGGAPRDVLARRSAVGDGHRYVRRTGHRPVAACCRVPAPGTERTLLRSPVGTGGGTTSAEPLEKAFPMKWPPVEMCALAAVGLTNSLSLTKGQG